MGIFPAFSSFSQLFPAELGKGLENIGNKSEILSKRKTLLLRSMFYSKKKLFSELIYSSFLVVRGLSFYPNKPKRTHRGA